MNIKQIKALSEGLETRTIQENLTEEQKSTMQEVLAENIIQVAVHKDEFDIVKESYNNKIKPLKSRITEITKHLRLGHIERVVECYKMPNHETGMMEYYDEDGQLVDERRLFQSERQLRLDPDAPLRVVNE